MVRGLLIFVVSVLQVAGTATLAQGGGSSVDLQLAASSLTVQVGDVVTVALSATADSPQAAHVVAIDALLTWNADVWELTGAAGGPGALPWQLAGFPAVSLNQGVSMSFQELPDNDGDALFQALATPGQANVVLDLPETVFTFEFTARAAGVDTAFELVASNGGFSTRVLTFGNGNITGDIASANGIVVVDVLGDLNCDGTLSVSDIGSFVLALTNPAQYAIQFPMCNVRAADINGDGFVTVSDIGMFVALLVA